MFRRLLGKLLNQRLERGVCRIVGNARLQANSNIVRTHRIRSNFQRKIDIGVVPSKARRHYSHDRVGLADQLQGLTHDAWIGAEVTLPEFVSQYGHRLRILTIDGVGRKEPASESRGHTEEVEGIRREIGTVDVFGKIAARDGETPTVGSKRVFYNRRFPDRLPLAGGKSDAAIVAG
jgi:hypothetical protein